MHVVSAYQSTNTTESPLPVNANYSPPVFLISRLRDMRRACTAAVCSTCFLGDAACDTPPVPPPAHRLLAQALLAYDIVSAGLIAYAANVSVGDATNLLGRCQPSRGATP